MGMKETGLPYYVSPFMQKDLDYLATRLQNTKIKRDAIIIFDGDEGSGKSTLSIHAAYYLAKQLGVEKYVNEKLNYFSPQQLYDAVMSKKKPKVPIFIYDEAVTGLLAKQSMTGMHIKLQIMFSTCRSKRYAIFINIPRFRELPDWMAIDRSLALYHCYNALKGNDPDHPGFYYGYGKESKRFLWIYQKSKQFGKAAKVFHTAPSKFGPWLPYDYEKYESYKRNELSKLENAKKVPENKKLQEWKDRTMKLSLLLEKEFSVKRTDISKYLGTPYNTFKDQVQDFARKRPESLGKGRF